MPDLGNDGVVTFDRGERGVIGELGLLFGHSYSSVLALTGLVGL